MNVSPPPPVCHQKASPKFGKNEKIVVDTPQIKTVYRIRNGQGLYSLGGQYAHVTDYKWHAAKGKVWDNRGHIINHLGQYGTRIPADWTVEKYDQITTYRKAGETPAQEFFADTLEIRENRRTQKADDQRQAMIQYHQSELARLTGAASK